jgi:uncharacterized SAM-binding protein YcdF (DUF218 family)
MIYTVSKLFTYLFLPPGIIIFLLILGAFTRAKIILLISALLLYFISTDYGANLLNKPLEKDYYKIKKPIKCNSVVVLGGGSNKEDTIKFSADAFKRLVYGLELASMHNLPLIFTGGGTKKYTEADGAKSDIENLKKAFHFNIKAYFENKAKDTVENAKYTKELIKKYNLSNNICLVTSAYHMKRSEIIFKNFGFNVTPLATGFSIKNKKFDFFKLFPNADAFCKSYKAIHEYFGILSLILRGYKI